MQHSFRKSIPIVIAALTFGVARADNELVYGNVSGWTITTDPQSGYVCSAEARYEGGSFLRIGYESTGDTSLVVMVSDPDWNALLTDASYSLELRFDTDNPQILTGTGLVDRGAYRIVVAAEHSDDFLQKVGHRYALSIGAVDREPVILSLGGSLAATRMLAECQAAFPDAG